MYFKKLELFGFKSFADRTKLVFEPGITAIVGPNGTGKSNISDSIKWVLGEQSAKQLRGGKMEDVIFNGTDTAQAVNIAEVSLTLSNSDRYLPIDYDEVVITRRIFRSGESEYLLNKTQVRLKDIQDILLGTGIGTSSYSIAEQGKMDKVINARPEDRREIFEEASGITKYKTKKKEALRKLEHTEINLARLADIINEVKRQINSIERQARKAERYQQGFNRLKELDIKLSLHQYKEIKSQVETKNAEHEQLKQKEGSISTRLNTYTQDFRNSRHELSTIEQTLTDIRNNLMNVVTTVDRNKSNTNFNDERVREIISRSEAMLNEIKDIEEKTDILNSQVDQMQLELDELNGGKGAKEQGVQEKEQRLKQISDSTKECEAAISQAKLGIMDNMSNQSKAKNENTKVLADTTSLGYRRRRLEAEKEAASAEISSFSDKFKHGGDIYNEQVKKTEAQCAKTKRIQDSLEVLNNRLSDLDKSIISDEKALVSSASKLELLRDLSEKKEGLAGGIKEYIEMLKESPQAKTSFVGVLVDIIKVNLGYERAIEAVLGEGLQSIVVKDEIAAKNAIDYLKNHQKGKATFIILDKCTISKRVFVFNITSRLSGNLSNFVECEDRFNDLVAYLFNSIHFAENLEEGLSLIRESRDKNIKVATRDGSFITRSKVTGGGIGSAEYTGIVGRKFKIEGLSKEIDDLKIKIQAQGNEHASLVSQQDALKNDLKAEDGALREEEKALAAKEGDRARLEQELKKIQEEFDLVKLEFGEIIQQEQEFKIKREELKQRLESLESEHQELQAGIAQRQKTIDINAQEKENIIISLTEVKTQLSLLSDKFSSQENTLNMLKDSLLKERLNLENRKNQIEQGNEKQQTLTSGTQRMVQENEILEQQREQLSAKITELEQKRYNISVTIEKEEDGATAQQKEIDDLKAKISCLQLNSTELNYQVVGIKDRVYQAYKVDIVGLDVAFDETDNWQEIALAVNKLKEKIDKMDPVNLVAIEEHKELQERYDFLTGQQQDLLDAKESLHKAINKINRTTRKLFLETFEQIKNHFKEYFKLLFGGGSADIYLIDQADILESGIEIIVRPPGKKLQVISLLSGGEKALTSIALLFALFKVRPSPFCILDEIDAPLDEANIDRFSRILQEFLNTSQFIIITHNKKTISIADVMYGITMEKSGISKIVSVKFAQDEKDKKKEPVQKRVQEPKEKVEEEPEEEPATVD